MAIVEMETNWTLRDIKKLIFMGIECSDLLIKQIQLNVIKSKSKRGR